MATVQNLDFEDMAERCMRNRSMKMGQRKLGIPLLDLILSFERRFWQESLPIVPQVMSADELETLLRPDQ